MAGARSLSPAVVTVPVEGGSSNDYDYVGGDPVNQLDLSGECLLGKRKGGGCKGGVRAPSNGVNVVKRGTKADVAGRGAVHVLTHAGVQVNGCFGYVLAYCASVGVNFQDGFTASRGGGHGLGWTGPGIGGTWQDGPTTSRGDCHSGGVGLAGGGVCYGGHRQYVADAGFGVGGYFHTDYRTYGWRPW